MRFSTIGTSWITELFIDTTKQSGEAELLSVYSRSSEKSKAFAKKHGADNYFTDLDKMLDDTSDFVYIASPNVLHFEHTIKCIEMKKHVFCEKPLVYTEDQWYKIRDAAKEAGVFVFEGFRHLFSPNFKTLQESLNRVGQVRSVSLQYIQYSSKYDAVRAGESPNVFTKEFAGGALMDLGIYPLSAAIDLFGEPLSAKYFPVLLKNGIDASGTLVLTYDKFIVTIFCSKAAQATMSSEIHGEDGTLTMDHISPLMSLSFYDHREKEIEDLSKPIDKFDMIYELTVFLKMVKENDIKTYEAWLERSRQVVKVLENVRREEGILFPGE